MDKNRFKEQKRVYMILQTVKNKNGEYIPCIAVENEKGYNLTDWAWGKDFQIAENIASEKNQKMGYTEKEVFQVILSTM